MATAKKTTKKTPAEKTPEKKATKASPVGRPPSLVKLVARDVPVPVAEMLQGLSYSLGEDKETVTTLALLHIKQLERVHGQFGIKCLLERQKIYLGR